MPNNAVVTDVSYTFRIKRIAEPKEFKNLWSLELNQGNGYSTIVDADNLSTVIDKMSHVFDVDGY